MRRLYESCSTSLPFFSFGSPAIFCTVRPSRKKFSTAKPPPSSVPHSTVRSHLPRSANTPFITAEKASVPAAMCSVSRFVASCIFIKSRSHPAPASGRRPERLVLRPYSRYFFPFLRRNIFTNSAKVHAAAPKPSTMAAKYTHGPSEKRRASQPAPSRHSTGGAASERPSCVSQDRFCKTENQPFFFTRHAPSAAGLRRAPAFCQAFCKYPLCKQHRYLLYLNTPANTIRNPGVPRQAPYKFSRKLCLICSETRVKIHTAECMTKNCR